MAHDDDLVEGTDVFVDLSAAATRAEPAVDGPIIWGDDAPAAMDTRYERGPELARGGLGRVLEAWDRRLARPVAIKEPLEPLARARFQREALLTARLQHPGIIPIYDAGVSPDGAPFYAMRLLGAGRSLGVAIAAAASLDQRLELLPHLIAAADAVAYAHDQGIVHRDLKPDNIILGPFGETMVIDWGLAKDLRAESTEAIEIGATPGATASLRAEPSTSGSSATPSPRSTALTTPLTLQGTTLGTPAFMSPEQVATGIVDERSDVYALGVALLELLSGRRASVAAMAARMSAGGADGLGPPMSLPDGAPAELAAILRQATAIDPARRYPSARELAADLRRFAAGQLVKAHRYSASTLVRRWLARHRLPVAIGAGALLALALLGAFSVRQVIEQRNVAESQRALAEERNQTLTLVQARTALDRDPTAAAAWLASYPPDAPRQDLARALVADAGARGVARHIFEDFRERVLGLGFARDGDLLVAADFARLLRVYDTESGRLLKELERLGGSTELVIVDRGRVAGAQEKFAGLIALTGGADGRILETDLSTGAERVFAGHSGRVTGLIALPGGRELVSSARDGAVRVWDRASAQGRQVATHTGGATAIAVPADGRSVVSVGIDGVVRWTPLAAGPAARAWQAGESLIAVALTPGDGETAPIAITAGERQVRAWDLATGASRELYRHDGIIGGLALSPDGRLVASGSRDRTVRVAALAADAGPPRIFLGHTDDIEVVRFSPDGRQLASAGLDGSVRLIDLASGQQRVLRGARLMVEALVFSPDGAWLAAGAQDPEVRVWPAAREEVTVLEGHDNDVDVVLFAPGPELAGLRPALLSAGHDGTIRVWPRQGDGWSQEARVLSGHLQAVDQLALLPGGRFLVSGSYDQTVRVWDLEQGTSQVLAGHGHNVTGLAIADGGRAVLSSSLDGTVRVWDLDLEGAAAGQGTLRHVLAGHAGAIHQLALAPDERLLATAGADGSVRLWDWRQGREEGLLRGHAVQVSSLAFAPDGRLASGAWDGQIRLWNSHDGKELAQLAGHTDRVRSLAFAPDGRTLASSSVDRSARLWDLASLEARVLRGHEASVRHVVFSPDGQLLATSSTDRTVRLWDVASGELRALRRYEGIVVSSAFSADGRFLAVGGWDKLVHVYPLGAFPLMAIGPGSTQRLIATMTTAATDAGGEIATRSIAESPPR
jgi:WD40 repeat protein